MVDISKTVTPKTDQLNYDNFSPDESKTIKIRDITGSDAKDQPIWIFYDGDNGKPYKPCLSMRRVLLRIWGRDGRSYIGRSLTLYGDPKVKFGGVSVGGIRISHMSDIIEAITMALTDTKASRKPFTVKPLTVTEQPTLTDMLSDIAAAPTLEGLKFKHGAAYKAYTDAESRAQIDAAKDKRKGELTAGGNDDKVS